MQNFSPLWLKTVTSMSYKNSENSEKFELRISNIRIVHDLTQDLWVIHAKFQSPLINVPSMSYKNSENSEKIEVLISNIRIVHDLTQDLWVIHANF